jgi:hypothetical protein
MAKGDAGQSLGELGRWLEGLHLVATAAAAAAASCARILMELLCSSRTRHHLIELAECMKLLISMIECPFPATVPLLPTAA